MNDYSFALAVQIAWEDCIKPRTVKQQWFACTERQAMRIVGFAVLTIVALIVIICN